MRRAIRRHRKLVLIVFALVMAGDVIGIMAVVPTWMGNARILVVPGPVNDLTPFSVAGRSTPAPESTISTLDVVEMIEARELAARLVQQYDLDKLPKPKGLRGFVQGVCDWAKESPGLILSKLTGSKPKELTPFDQAVDDFLNEREDISEEQDTKIVNVGIWAESPKLANDLSNSLAELLVEEERKSSQREAEKAYQYALQELATAQVRADKAQEKLKVFREREHFSDPQQETQAASSRLEQLWGKRDATRAELADAGASLTKTNSQLAGQKATITASQVIATNPVVKQIRADLVKQESDLAGLLQQKQEAHPDVQKLRAKMAQNRDRLRSEIERMVESETVSANPAYQRLLLDSLTLEAHRQGLQAALTVQNEAVATAQRELNALAAKSVEFARLNEDVKAAVDVADQLRVSVHQLSALRRTDIALGGTRLRIVDRAAIPDEQTPDSPKALIDLAAGLVAGVVLSIALALLIEYWREEPVGHLPEDELRQKVTL